MESGVLVYKCRSCAKLNKNMHVPDGITAMCRIPNNIPLPEKWGAFKPTMTDVCNCNGNDMGISDLIGFEKDK